MGCIHWAFFMPISKPVTPTAIREKQRILSFIILLKKHRRNSTIYKADNKLILATQMGISYNAYKKYFHLAVEAGLLIKRKDNFQAVHFVKCLHVLGLSEKIRKHEDVFKNFNYTTVTFKDVYEQVVSAIMLRNLKQQAYRIERNEILFSTATDNCIKNAKNRAIKKLSKQAAKDGITTDQLLSSIKSRKINYIVTGKFHISTIIGCSPTSGLNWLRKLTKKKVITRKVNSKFIQRNCNPDQYQHLIDSNYAGMVVPVMGGYRRCKGSVITIL